MKTLNQIAKENKVSKQQVYRIYKSEIEVLHEAHQINGVIYLNEADENIDINSFLEKNKFEAHQKYIIEILNEQLKVKDRQIADLNERLAESQELQRAHQVLLHQNQLQLQEKEKIIEELEEKNKAEESIEKESETIELDPVKKSLWSRIFG